MSMIIERWRGIYNDSLRRRNLSLGHRPMLFPSQTQDQSQFEMGLDNPSHPGVMRPLYAWVFCLEKEYSKLIGRDELQEIPALNKCGRKAVSTLVIQSVQLGVSDFSLSASRGSF